tara:strand:+ start:101 stop:637 length:537 start_codon:yes stop_codon:yes gene_type:complete
MYNYKFKFSDGNIILSSENAEIVFSKIKLLPKLIHGCEGFKNEKENIVDGFFETDIIMNYIDNSIEFSEIISCILDLANPSYSVINYCLRLGGCEYLEEKFKNINKIEMDKEYIGSIVDPTWDSKNMFEWKQISCSIDQFSSRLEELTDKGYYLVSSTDYSSEKSLNTLYVFNFRKIK